LPDRCELLDPLGFTDQAFFFGLNDLKHDEQRGVAVLVELLEPVLHAAAFDLAQAVSGQPNSLNQTAPMLINEVVAKFMRDRKSGSSATPGTDLIGITVDVKLPVAMLKHATEAVAVSVIAERNPFLLDQPIKVDMPGRVPVLISYRYGKVCNIRESMFWDFRVVSFHHHARHCLDPPSSWLQSLE
jgi:hypothetical protein